MSKGILRLMAVLLAFGLVAAACGDSDDSGDSEAGASTTTGADEESTETTAATETSAASTTAAGDEDAVAAPEGDPIVLGAVLPLSGP